MTRITQIPAVLSHYLKHGVAAHLAPLGSNEGIMDQGLFKLHDATGGSRKSPVRRSRPLTRVQEFAVLGVAFALGAALQVAYLMQGGQLTP